MHCARYPSYPPSATQLFSPSHARFYRNYLRHSITDWRKQLQHDDNHTMTGTKSATSNSSSAKRKRSSPKFYAVKVGRTPGIYHSWEDCKAQTEGFKSQFKSFPTLTEAEAFMRGISSPSADTSKTPKFYAVAVGHVPGVYTDYPSVQAQTKDCPGARQQSFATRAEAEAYVNEFRRDSSAPISLRGDLCEESSLAASKGSKKQKKKDAVVPALTNGDVTWEPGMGPLPDGAEDGFDPNIILDTATGNIRNKTVEERSKTKMQPTGDFSGTINVYTDGSSLGNGHVGAVGGVGVYFGPNDSRNISEPLRGGRQTNQRAELTAVARALDHVPIDRSVLIHTDSNYSIKCLTEWFQKWETNNWKSSSGKDVENKDLVEPIIARIRERDLCRAKTEFKWIKGHANDPGNTAADLLAVQGSRNSTPDLRAADIKDISATLSGRPSSKLEETYSEKKEVFNEEDGADYDRIFADLEAERLAQKDDHGFTSDVVAQLTEASTWESQGGN